jgi:hypothetical protein
MFRMLTKVIDELDVRGHKIEYLINPKFDKHAKAQGYKDYVLLPQIMQNDTTVLPVNQALAEFDYLEHGHWEMGRLFIELLKVIDGNYEQLYTFLDDYFERTGKPDMLVVDFFSLPAIDWAKTNGVKYVIFHGSSLGIVAGFGDCFGCPATLFPETRTDALSFKTRLYKFFGAFSFIWHGLDYQSEINRIRAKLGVKEYMGPIENWAGISVIVPVSYSIDIPRKLPPSIHVVGLLEDPFNPTRAKNFWDPEDLELWNFLDSLPAPIVYVSFGSEPWFFPVETLAELLEGIEHSLKKFGGSIVIAMRPEIQKIHGGTEALKKKLPESVHVLGWINQEMVLAHPNVRVFVTHGGLQSVSEGLLNLVPMLVIPQFGDQPSNAARIQENGLGLFTIDSEITRARIASQISQLLTDQSFGENLKKHFIINRRGYPPEKQAADVIEMDLMVGSEFLLTVDEVAPSWIAHGYDIMGFILVVVGVVVWVIVKLLKCLLCGCRGSKNTTPKRKKKEE